MEFDAYCESIREFITYNHPPHSKSMCVLYFALRRNAWFISLNYEFKDRCSQPSLLFIKKSGVLNINIRDAPTFRNLTTEHRKEIPYLSISSPF